MRKRHYPTHDIKGGKERGCFVPPILTDKPGDRLARTRAIEIDTRCAMAQVPPTASIFPIRITQKTGKLLSLP
ncbi:hypothetical protein [Syntrophorhabdus aromaticivorans]|mgnify:CR=1 FL=1|jgi:hypothetical protein|uniref:Uncharacterized protein n=1 Tax=Syntrophorhabdus aromaticivorans TaxID=328301 RepID=A0A351U2B6_9BACT|nr:hypothetical protein [Syntrophorhabdus aromaticivorans]NLW35142.1 hypothetical protein [Syntrophorhabdus aromaticivorans]HBA54097.1 hypothetical protein [Syntrophorhabdus aromaticivorans]